MESRGQRRADGPSGAGRGAGGPIKRRNGNNLIRVSLRTLTHLWRLRASRRDGRAVAQSNQIEAYKVRIYIGVVANSPAPVIAIGAPGLFEYAFNALICTIDFYGGRQVIKQH